MIRVIAKVTTRAQPQWLREMKQQKIGVQNQNCFQCYGVVTEQQICACGTDRHVTVHWEQNESYLWQGRVLKLEYHTVLAILPFFFTHLFKMQNMPLQWMQYSGHVAGICGTTHQHE